MYTTELNIKNQTIPIRHMKDDLFYTPVPLKNVFPIFKAVNNELFVALDINGDFQLNGSTMERMDRYIKKFHELERSAPKLFVPEYHDGAIREFKADFLELFKVFLNLKSTRYEKVLTVEMSKVSGLLYNALASNSIIAFPTGLCVKPVRFEKVDSNKFIFFLDIIYQTPTGSIHPEFYVQKSACRTYTQVKRTDLNYGSNLNNQKCETYTVADTHFFHKGILTIGKARKDFKNLDEMHDNLIELWNSKVEPCDNIIVVGDFSFKGVEATAELICRLNGRIVFVEGNHDRKMLQGLGMPHYSYLELNRGSLKICISHFPIMCWNGQARGAIHLHGHTHGHLRPIGKMFDVGIDNTNNILNINDAVSVADSRDIICPDGRNL